MTRLSLKRCLDSGWNHLTPRTYTSPAQAPAPHVDAPQIGGVCTAGFGQQQRVVALPERRGAPRGARVVVHHGGCDSIGRNGFNAAIKTPGCTRLRLAIHGPSPAGTGREYYRRVKIAGEDVVEEPVQEQPLDSIPGYEEETRSLYSGGLTEGTAEETLAE